MPKTTNTRATNRKTPVRAANTKTASRKRNTRSNASRTNGQGSNNGGSAFQQVLAAVGRFIGRTSQFVASERKRLLPWLTMLVAIIGSVVLFRGLASNEVMPLQRLEVVGELKRVQLRDVVEAAKPHASSGFFTVNLRQVRHAVEALPYVARVEVNRIWPDALRIRVVERKGWSRWQSSQGVNGLMNYDGLVYAEGSELHVDDREVPEDAPLLIGPAESGAELAINYRRLLPKLAAVNKSIQALARSSRGEWRLTLGSGVELRLGQAPFEGRLNTYLRLAKEQLASAELTNDVNGEQRGESPLLNRIDEIAYLDLRYPHGFAVGWRSAELAANP